MTQRPMARLLAGGRLRQHARHLLGGAGEGVAEWAGRGAVVRNDESATQRPPRPAPAPRPTPYSPLHLIAC
jgi:hypothetical protein